MVLLNFFNEVTKSDYILKSIEANVIDSCIEVIIGLPDIRSHRLVHRIPSYFNSPDATYLVPPQGTSQASTPPIKAYVFSNYYHLSCTIYRLPSNYHLSIIYLSSIYHLIFFYRSSNYDLSNI